MRTQEERTMAMIAHGSAILNIITLIGGIVVAAVVYFSQKEKSAWVAFQALQSLIYQVVTMVLVGILFIFFFIISAFTAGLGCLCIPIPIVIGLAAIGYSLYAAYQTNQGLEFKYAVIGDWAESQQPPTGPAAPPPPPPAPPTPPAPPAEPTPPPAAPTEPTPPPTPPTEPTPPAA